MVSNSQTTLQEAIDAVGDAFGRLDAAIERSLDARISSGAQSDSALTAIQSENDALTQENQRLANQLQQLQQDYLALQKASQRATTRLDASIRQLDMVLES